MRPVLQAELFTHIEEFLIYLSDQGFPCGIGERLRARDVFAAAHANGRETRLKTMLCPIFARSEADQVRFLAAYDLFFAGQLPAEPPPVRQGEKPLSMPEALRLSKQPLGWRRPVTSAVVLVAVMGLSFYFDAGVKIRRLWETPTPQETNPPPPPLQPSEPNVVYRQVPYEVSLPYERSCRGSECLTEGCRGWLIPIPLLLAYLTFCLSRTSAWQRWRMLRRERKRGPPFASRVIRYTPQLTAFQGVLNRTAEAMRIRLSGDFDELDVPRTIDATIHAAGFPDLRFRAHKKVPVYLFLIEQQNIEDHFARWWIEVGGLLRRRGVSISVIHYSDDLRVCYPEGSHTAVSTPYLLDRHEHSTVIVFGKGRHLLHRFTGEVLSWADMCLVKRDQRAMLTPMASFEWGAAERKVGSKLPMLPARLLNLAVATAALDSTQATSRESREMPSIPPSYFDEKEEDADGERPSLCMFFDDDVFEWLCLCAIYPRLEWELTLHIGLIVDPGGQIFEERKLLQMIRLAWFREGKMPGRWRAWLVELVDPAKTKAVRELLIQALRSDRAPKGSFARDFQDLQLAAQLYWLDPANPERRAELEAAMRSLAPSDIAEDVGLDSLRKTWKGPSRERRVALSWQRFRRSGLGVALVGLAAAIGVGAVVLRMPVLDVRKGQTFRYEAVNSGVQDPKTPYRRVVAAKLKGPDLEGVESYNIQFSDGTQEVVPVSGYEIRFAVSKFTNTLEPPPISQWKETKSLRAAQSEWYRALRSLVEQAIADGSAEFAILPDGAFALLFPKQPSASVIIFWRIGPSLTFKNPRCMAMQKFAIQQAVGRHAPNQSDDVMVIQALLNLNLSAQQGVQFLDEDGGYGKYTQSRIEEFQRLVTIPASEFGVIEPGSHTITALLRGLTGDLDELVLRVAMPLAGASYVNRYFKPLLLAMAANQINTPLRQAHFLAQLGHDSESLRLVEENRTGAEYERRADMGNTEPGDGARFKGRGLGALTGRANYTLYGKARNRDFVTGDNPTLLAADPMIAADSAAWFWDFHRLNTWADKDNGWKVSASIDGIGKDGQPNGIADRMRRLRLAKCLLCAGPSSR